MLPWSAELAGRFEQSTLDSTLLRDNPLGDPHQRQVLVYLPPGYDESDRRYPSIYVAIGYTGHVGMWFNRTAFRQPYPEQLDALFAAGDVPPAIVVFFDGWNRFGGSQYVDSPGTGRYHSHLCEEIVPWVDATYRTVPERDQRAITGKSSGGYAAMVTPMLRPDLFGALATHAGDASFELCYRPEFPQRARELRDRYAGSFENFFAEIAQRPNRITNAELGMLEIYGCSAAYSADPDGTVQLPFDELGEIRPEVWQRWLALDPVVMGAGSHREALGSLRAVWIDAGKQDEYYLDLGATAFERVVRAAGVPAVHFELFEGAHGGIEYRYPLAIQWLCEQLSR
ncbi:putative esterase [Kribbella flavida DSM 17836]|uniref:Putative esterase n=1 Tax=Kribbella flavida (strain DSM 17836 / JCM 10339 / NBRC 14399) TaxID=479435 RepID=D2PW08_KRIFD|nr:alpha/beta hydrolase-fold protein [Kribbella flavida]ADB29665.1 putative esterase [Kribbella flavida DSM 17836]